MKENENQNVNINTKNKKSKARIIIVIAFLVFFVAVSYVQLRGNYLEYKELGESYVKIFYTNLSYRYGIMAVNFVIVYFIIYFTNNGIKKGLKPFFEKEKKEMPKLLNKSLALIISTLISIVVSVVFTQKLMLVMNMTSFGIQDSVYKLDIAYYIFQKPIIEMFLVYLMALIVGLSIYMALYYVIVFNRYFDGIDGSLLKESLFLKKILKNLKIFVILLAIMTNIRTQNMLYGKLLSVSPKLEIVGAGFTETKIKLWGYTLFSLIIIVVVFRAIKRFKEGQTGKLLKNLAVIPGYLVVLFTIMMSFDLIYLKNNELDKEKEYISENIKNTKNAYNLNIEETNIQNSGTVTKQDIE
ncbi:MAG: UPF0182 family protein, partial [Clostridia bacterium]|nr:UPF0182 family protein [Clostridia bacterium]